ncbi:hypothetical protein M378DRAFT_1010911 [Amanita muscaria Koide BX008]|uniref:Uncharacterized protein n=1 Tax=Amanita muscaria (strain Koide BX008) TaxID=946122 RepID=A0A0C2WRQ2_AMAMK|nr:hypothetical protein M378DRAFT_1010911 [Amanita muscaria Koide BX008]
MAEPGTCAIRIIYLPLRTCFDATCTPRYEQKPDPGLEKEECRCRAVLNRAIILMASRLGVCHAYLAHQCIKSKLERLVDLFNAERHTYINIPFQVLSIVDPIGKALTQGLL